MNPANALLVCGAECGIAAVGTTSAGLEHWVVVSGAPTVVTSGPTMRSTRCFRFNASGAAAAFNHTLATGIAAPATVVARFYIWFATMPTATTIIFNATAAGTSQGCAIIYHQASGQLRARTINSVGTTINEATSGIAVTTGQWYRIDFKGVHNTTQTADFQVDGVAATQATGAGVSADFRALVFGSLATFTGDFYMDDIVVSGTSGDYPIGAGTVVGLYPSADGTHGGTWATGAFGKSTGGATNAARTDTDLWNSLDNPLVATAAGSWVSDLTAVALTDYVEFVMGDLPGAASTVNGVMCVATSHSAAATANNFDLRLADSSGGAAASFMSILDLSETTITIPVAILTADRSAAAWDVSKVNDARVRFSSTDSNPDVYLDGVCLEVDYVPSAGPTFVAWHSRGRVAWNPT